MRVATTQSRRSRLRRAREDLEQIASTPHPTGSLPNEHVRDYLESRLRGLGLVVHSDTTTVARHAVTNVGKAGVVTNLRARPDRDTIARGPTVLLTAHHDSVPAGAGAADNAMGVAAVLASAEAMLADGRTDFEVLLTDGEEAGLLGAAAFARGVTVEEASRFVVLNLDSRGAAGRPVLYDGDPEITAALPVRLRARLTSVGQAVYRFLPNDTDLSALRRGGMRGINLGVVGGSAAYHTSHDRSENVSDRTLSGMVEHAVRLATALADATVSDRQAPLTQFTFAGLLVSYPARWDLCAGALGLGGELLALARRSSGSRRRVLAAAATRPVVWSAATAAGGLAWQVHLRARPHYSGFVLGDPYRPRLARGATFLAAGATALAAESLASATGADSAERSAGSRLVSACVGTTLGVAVPGTAYPFVLPSVFRSVLRRVGELSGRAEAGAAADRVADLVTAVTLGPVVSGVADVVGQRRAGPVTAAASLLLRPLGWFATDRGRTAARRAATLLVAAGAVACAGLFRNGPVHARPGQVRLRHVRDLASGGSYWVSGPAQGVRATSAPHGAARAADDLELAGRFAGRWSPAPVLDGARPHQTISVDPGPQRGSHRVSVTATTDGPVHALSLTLRWGPDVALERLDCDGLPTEDHDALVKAARAARCVQLRWAAPEGRPVSLGVHVSGSGRVVASSMTHSRLPEGLLAGAAPRIFAAGGSGEAIVRRSGSVTLPAAGVRSSA